MKAYAVRNQVNNVECNMKLKFFCDIEATEFKISNSNYIEIIT